MKIVIGESAGGKKVGFDLDTLITTRLLIQANSGAGKSYLLRKLMEVLFGHVQIIGIDPEGEFSTLREKFGFVLVGKGGETPADIRSAAAVAEKLLELKASAICDLYEMKVRDRHAWVKTFLEAMINAPKKLWHPVIVIVDEAHIFCPEKGAGESEASDAMIDLATRGRKRGFCSVFATQRLAKLRNDAAAELQNVLIGGTFLDVDIERAAKALGIQKGAATRDFAAHMKVVPPGTFVGLGRAISKEQVEFTTGKVQTSHPQPGSAKHAAEPPPPPEKVMALLPKLADLPKEAEEKARTVEDFKRQIRELRADLAQEKKVKVRVGDTLVIDPKQIETHVNKALQKRDGEWRTAVQLHLKSTRESVRQSAAQIVHSLNAMEFVPPAAPANEIVPIRTTVGIKPVPSSTAASAREETRPESSNLNQGGGTPDNNGTLSRSQNKILESLATFEAIGRTPVSKKWTAALSEASHSSSTFGNNLGALRSQGLIDYPQPGMVELTGAGRTAAPTIDAPSSSEELLERCRKILSASQWAILQTLVNAYPQALSKKELADRVGASSSSSTYGNNLGALRSAGMIDYPAPGSAKASGWLFLE